MYRIFMDQIKSQTEEDLRERQGHQISIIRSQSRNPYSHLLIKIRDGYGCRMRSTPFPGKHNPNPTKPSLNLAKVRP